MADVKENCPSVSRGQITKYIEWKREDKDTIGDGTALFQDGSRWILYLAELDTDTFTHHKKKLRGFSPQANSTDRATAACRRS
jgi:hypothetical protein